MQKKTMWITAAAVGAVLVLGGAGAAVASSDIFDDGTRATSTPSVTGSDDRSRSDDGLDDSDGRSDTHDNSGRDGSDDGSDDRGRGSDDNGGDRDRSDDNTVPATADERSAAEAAALEEIGQGTVREFDTGDSDDDYAYKVELVMDDGGEVEVEFAADLSVLRIDRD
ncbi:hypothetical protein SAMN06295879_0331 [Agreia bicolorata]|uniref:Peptidase propeptide and YPEB domain-containing protein n=1 Tax=Agreia bicolorata TaxID=110935 RepID=A0A1T4WX66_9MICO|nr:hypothetical protein [Agreia bicolorata]SKA81468.1 hypothetical protein SAMN06295879_0331 [Agreia bicolorata]